MDAVQVQLSPDVWTPDHRISKHFIVRISNSFPVWYAHSWAPSFSHRRTGADFFRGARSICPNFYPHQEFIEGFHNNFWKTCPSLKRLGDPQIWLSVPFEGLINTQIIILTYFPKHKISRGQATYDKQLYSGAQILPEHVLITWVSRLPKNGKITKGLLN